MDEEFRGALADVVDGRTWAGYAGPGAPVRERGRRRRRRRVATSVAGMVAAVTVVAAGVGTAIGPGDAKSAVPGGWPSSPASGHGRYVKLTDAAMQPADVGSGYTLGSVTDGWGPFAGMLCAPVAPVAVVGPVVRREFSTRTGSAGQPLSVHEVLYQFPDAASAKTAFARTRTAAQAAACKGAAGSVSAFQDVGGVGDAMFVHNEYGGPLLLISAAVLEGQVIVVNEAVPGSADAKALGGSWLTDLSQKAVTRVRNAPRTDVLEQNPVAVPAITLSPGVTNGGPAHPPSPSPLPVSQPVDGFLFAPADLGPSFTATQSEEWHSKQITSATSATGMIFRGTMAGGSGEFMVNEGVYRFTDATAAQSGIAAYRQDTTSTHNAAASLPGFGDEAWIKRWDTKGGATIAIRSGAEVITFDVLAGGASADQPIPGGDAWVRQIAHTALVRLASVKW